MRGLAVLFMIAVHAQMLFTLKPETKELWGKIVLILGGAPAAPTFLYLMGFLIGVKPKGTWASLLPRALGILALGYLLNLTRFSLPLWLQIPLKGDPVAGLFMIDILQLAAPAMLLLWFLHGRNQWLLAFLFVGIPLLAPFLWGITSTPGVFDFLWGNGELVFFTFFPWAAYPIFGLFAAKLPPQRRLWIGALLFAGGVAVNYSIPRDSEIFSYYRTFPAQVFWMLGFCALWHSAALKFVDRVPALVLKALTFFSENVTAAYVFSWLILSWAVAIPGYRSLRNEETLGVMVATTLLTALSIFAWKHRPYLQVRKQ
jgi:hypothetical protein